MFKISQDSDFIVHQPASREEVYSYQYEDGPGPNPQNLAFDLANGSRTPWNAKVLDLLLTELQERCTQEGWPFQRSDRYYKAIIEERYKRLWTVWKAAQPKVTEKGVLETAAEVEDRVNTKKDETLKAVRQSTRRRNVSPQSQAHFDTQHLPQKYVRRITVLKHLVEQKSDQKDEDLPAWQWLQRLVKILGDGGMSSEESDVENEFECVLRVKNMGWQREIERELNIVDHQRMLDDDIFAPQGSKPLKRIRAPGNPKTTRKPTTGLPEIFYNSKWLAGLSEREVEGLEITNEMFKWMKVVVA
jgi:hypothetical protein